MFLLILISFLIKLSKGTSNRCVKSMISKDRNFEYNHLFLLDNCTKIQKYVIMNTRLYFIYTQVHLVPQIKINKYLLYSCNIRSQ